MKETIDDPEIYQRAIRKGVDTTAPMRLTDTMADYAWRVGDFAVKAFEDEIDAHRRKQQTTANLTTLDQQASPTEQQTLRMQYLGALQLLGDAMAYIAPDHELHDMAQRAFGDATNLIPGLRVVRLVSRYEFDIDPTAMEKK